MRPIFNKIKEVKFKKYFQLVTNKKNKKQNKAIGYIQIVTAVCIILCISPSSFAEETLDVCANGVGTVITGVSGHKYCKSNTYMNWWNAYTWCDVQGRRMFSMEDCSCDALTNCEGICPELKGATNEWSWTITPSGVATSYLVTSGHIKNTNKRSEHFRALCY